MLVSKKSFSFIVLAFNHENYIIEHLESIKYQVQHFGEAFDVAIIINDDYSSDKTKELVDKWLSLNHDLFFKIYKLYNDENIGTCKSLCNALNKLDSQYCKITAGDDVYSSENIFELVGLVDDFDIVSGLPVRLVDKLLYKDHGEIFNTIATDTLYKKKPFNRRVEGINFINAPNAMYSVKHLKNPSLMEFLNSFDVVEDWPLQIFISDTENAKCQTVDKSYVYYRRTSGSTFLVASARFRVDVLAIYSFLIEKQTNFFKKMLLRNRRFCFLLDSRILKKIFNLSIYLYVMNVFLYLPAVMYRLLNLKINIDEYSKHYLEILNNVNSFKKYLENK